MSATISLTPDSVTTALIAFIAAQLGLSSSQVVAGISNRLPMPLPGFVAVTYLYQTRIETNTHTYSDGFPTLGGYAYTTTPMRIDVQIDCYGPNAGAWAATLVSLLRDDIGYQGLQPNCAPLYCDDARMAPLIDAEAQYEQRWSLTCALQYNPTVTTGQDFAASLGPVDIINVDVTYSP